MPLTFADGGNIQNVTNTEPVNATVANRPHDILKTRTEEIETFVEESESLEIMARGLAPHCDEVISWGGPLDGTGDGLLVIGNNASGELRFSEPGNADAVYKIPYNELAGYFAADPVSNPLNEGEVLYFDLTDFAGRSSATFPLTILTASIGKGTSVGKYQLPIGKVYDDDFIFAWSGDLLAQGASGYLGSYGATSSWAYGDDYTLVGELRFTENAGGVEVTPTTIDTDINFSNKYSIAHNRIAFGSVAVTLAQDELAYVDLDLGSDGALLTVSKAAYGSYTPDPLRIPLWARGNAATETEVGAKTIHVFGTGDTVILPTGVGLTTGYAYGLGPTNVKIGSSVLDDKGALIFEQNVGGAGAGIIHDGEWDVKGPNATITHTDASGKVTHSYDVLGVELELPDTGTLKVIQAGGGTGVNVEMAGTATAGLGFVATAGGLQLGSTSGKLEYTSARGSMVSTLAACGFKHNPNHSPSIADGAYWAIDGNVDPTCTFYIDPRPYFVAGGTITDIYLFGSSDDIASNLEFYLYSKTGSAASWTTESTDNGTTGSGVLTTIDTVPETGLSITAATNKFWGIKVVVTTAVNQLSRFYGMEIDYKFTEFLPG